MYNLFKRKWFFFRFILLFISFSSFSQQNDEIIKNIRNYDYEDAKILVSKTENSSIKSNFNQLIYLLENRGIHKIKDSIEELNIIEESTKDFYLKSLQYLNKSLHILYYKNNYNKLALFSFLQKSLENAILSNNKPLICEVIKGYLSYYQTIISINDKTHTDYLKMYAENVYDETENNLYQFYSKIIDFERAKNPEIIKKIIPNLYTLKNEISQKTNLSRIYLRIGNYQQIEKKDIDSAFYYYNKAENLFDKANKGFEFESLIKIQSNKARLMILNNNAKEAITILKKMTTQYKGYPFNLNKIYLEYYLALGYKNLKKYDSAYYYGMKSNADEKKIDQKLHLASIYEINTKYQSEKKEKENLQLKIEKEKTNNFLIASLLFIFLSSIITVLTFKNSNKKRKVAEQQKELETQKNLTLLKEQEITTINAMVDGQEKERKQIAEDLHDNLGSVLATLKLHFEKLKINCEKNLIDPEILFNKTENLIDEAYIKVRSIAHAKNSGVIANEGLLVAIRIMADKISSADNIKIEVIDFGLNKRLKNSLEITIFRIIQELITNVIKHAEAKNATINISLYDKNLNIIIEDDGKGFDFKKVNLKKGMGISSIKTRIDHLKGTFKIDSTLEKGSSIIIDIPFS
jgi:signal transduction histidine kinase